MKNKKDPLQCPNCLRSMPSLKHRREKGCKWCIQETSNSCCDGKH